MTKSEWHYEWRALYDKLTRDYPHKDPKWRFQEAHRIMRARRGPEPPGLVSAVLQAALGYLRAGGTDMKWDWTKTLWKSVRSAAMVAVAGAVFAFLGGFDTPEELVSSGVPGWLAPAGALLVAGIISGLRNWLAISRPQWNVVRRAGEKIRPALNGS